MCGIIGILGEGDVIGRIVEGLKRLEYRGYDSAGVAALQGQAIERRRAAGKLENVVNLLKESPLVGSTGIGHTRWATHGEANTTNAHPHATDRLAVVHNGIIENFTELRRELENRNCVFATQTDTEVIVQLINDYLEREKLSAKEAVRKALSRLKGAYALAIIFAGHEDLMIVARRGSPLAIGAGQGEMYVGSDAHALAPFTNRITYLEEGDWATISRGGFEIFNASNEPVERSVTISTASEYLVDKDGYRHFMAKEIHEQPQAIAHTLSRYIDSNAGRIKLRVDDFDFQSLDRLTISACGTAYYAGLVSRYWFETWAQLSVEIDIASELRYRDVPYAKQGGAIFISQSGETADTLAALRNAKNEGQRIAAVVNVEHSSIAREADAVFPIAAGPEIGVASTKAFTCQLATLACLALAAGKARGVLSDEQEEEIVRALLTIPRLMGETLQMADQITEIAESIAKVSNCLYIGRGLSFPLAMEGALKLKEISYIHAEGYAAGELKHGPIALIDENTPIVVIAPSDKHFEKTVSNMHEVIARQGKTLLISDARGLAQAGDEVWSKIEIPDSHSSLAPLIYAIPLQLLAYDTAIKKGTDVDQPRNLAKSVTVE